jgi:anti-sigma B factor antagonist
MDVTVTDGVAPQPAIITLRGQLDLETAPRMQAALAELMSRNISRVVIDLSGLTFCDSIGLSAFVLVHRQCADAGGYLRLAEPGPFLARVLTVLGLDGPIPVYNSLAQACTEDGNPAVGVTTPPAQRSPNLQRDA